MRDNVILEIEFGEVASENIGNGIIRTLALINHLEINEQILYAHGECRAEHIDRVNSLSAIDSITN
jgi:hypothetical protein